MSQQNTLACFAEFVRLSMLCCADLSTEWERKFDASNRSAEMIVLQVSKRCAAHVSAHKMVQGDRLAQPKLEGLACSVDFVALPD